MFRPRQSLVGSVVILVMAAGASVPARAVVVIGDWEGNPDGWIDWGASQTPVAGPRFTYAADVGVTHGASSLKLTQANWNQNLAVKLQDIGHLADFFANKQFLIDVTLPTTTQAGWAEIFEFTVNAEGFGWSPQMGNPVQGTHFEWGDGGRPEQKFTLTWDYGHLVDGNPDNGEIATTAGYVEFIFATNNDGVHDTFYFDNARLVGARLPGDTNEDGVINRDDFALIDRGFARYLAGVIPAGAATWTDGDFTGDGAINSGDYLVIDQGFLAAGGASPAFLADRQATFGPEYIASLMSSVPEPGFVGFSAALGVATMGRRRRGTRGC